jgi:hypothetical protein
VKMRETRRHKGLEDVYRELWRTPRKDPGGIINYLLAGSLDGVSRAMLRYLADFRSAETDSDVPRCSSGGTPFVLLTYTFAANKAWLYLYNPGNSRFGVLKVKPGQSFDRIVRRCARGAQLVLCVSAGSMRHFAGLNKVRKYGRVSMRVRWLKRPAEVPCITEEDFGINKEFYECVLGQLGIVPPLLVQLPRDVQVVEPEVGVILPIKQANGEIRTAVVPLRHLHRMSFTSFSAMLQSVQRLASDTFQQLAISGNFGCTSLRDYMEQKRIKLFIEYLSKEAFSPSLDEIRIAGTQELYIDLLRDLRHVHGALETCIDDTLRASPTTVKKAVMRLIDAGAECVLTVLSILPKPGVVRSYELGFLKRLSRAGLCLRQFGLWP